MAKSVKCIRCGYEWTPLVRRGRPKQCPRCRNRNWWKPYERPPRKNYYPRKNWNKEDK